MGSGKWEVGNGKWDVDCILVFLVMICNFQQATALPLLVGRVYLRPPFP